MKKFGRKVPSSSRITLRDAQGTRIKVSDQRVIEVEFRDVQGNIVKVEEVFLISSVVHPLLAVGKLENFRRKVGSSQTEQPQEHFSQKEQRGSQ